MLAGATGENEMRLFAEIRGTKHPLCMRGVFLVPPRGLPILRHFSQFRDATKGAEMRFMLKVQMAYVVATVCMSPW